MFRYRKERKAMRERLPYLEKQSPVLHGPGFWGLSP